MCNHCGKKAFFRVIVYKIDSLPKPNKTPHTYTKVEANRAHMIVEVCENCLPFKFDIGRKPFSPNIPLPQKIHDYRCWEVHKLGKCTCDVIEAMIKSGDLPRVSQ